MGGGWGRCGVVPPLPIVVLAVITVLIIMTVTTIVGAVIGRSVTLSVGREGAGGWIAARLGSHAEHIIPVAIILAGTSVTILNVSHR
jgi:hypothetical protein